jgi:hypothetical protein
MSSRFGCGCKNAKLLLLLVLCASTAVHARTQAQSQPSAPAPAPTQAAPANPPQPTPAAPPVPAVPAAPMPADTAGPATDVWRAVNEPTLDPAKSTEVENIVLTRDRLRITLRQGSVQFSAPIQGKAYGAVFHGKGLVEIAPPNSAERQQLQLYTDQDTLNMPFTEGVLWFTDKTYDEIAEVAHWSPGGLKDDTLFAERTKREGSPRARWFKGILSLDHNRTALFEADLNTEAKGWIQVKYDALDPEEISAGRWVRPFDFSEFETWLHFPARDRSVEEAYHLPLGKNDFHVTNYKIDATVTRGAELEATTTAKLEPLASGEQVLDFDLDPHLRVDRVTDDAGHSLAFFQPSNPGEKETAIENFLEVVLAEPTSFDPVTLEFHYAGKHVVSNVGDGNFFCESFGWYPAVDNFFATRSYFDLTFHSPKQFELVATGDKTGQSTDGNWLVTTWKTDPAISAAGFAFGDYKIEEQKTGNTNIDVYANRNPDEVFEAIKIYAPDAPLGTLSPAAMSKTMSVELGNMIRVFESYYGPYPYHSLAITNIPGDYGQGWPGLIYLSAISFLDEEQQHVLGINKLIWVSDYWRGHETSHQWWGQKVGWKSYHDQWLSEGFAQFSGNLYVEFRDSPKEYLERIREDREQLLTKDVRGRTYESLGPIWMGQRVMPPEEPQAYQNVVYNKGGYVLHMLRMMLNDPRQADPDAAFKSMMQEYTQTYANEAASTGDFKGVVERHMNAHMDLDGNRTMDWFFNEYVYGTGVPEYHFAYTTETTPDNKVKISATIDRTGVPDEWKDTLPVYFYRSGKPTLLGWATARAPHTTLQFILPFTPEKLAIDAFEDTLAIVK